MAEFWVAVVLGIAAMAPRAMFAARRAAAGPEGENMEATGAARFGMVIPALCALFWLIGFKRPLVGVLLIVIYLVAFIGLILLFKRGERGDAEQ